MKNYIVPEYVVKKHIPERFQGLFEEQTLLTNKTLTVKEVAVGLGMNNFDIALPLEWTKPFEKMTGANPYGHFVWCYDMNSTWGEPMAVTVEGITMLKIYRYLVDKE